MVLFLGMRLVLDLRMTGWAFGGTAAAEMVKRVGPWSLVGAIVTVVSGLALYSADPARMAGSAMFQFKVAALSAALVNAWFFQPCSRGACASGTSTATPPARAGASAYLSLALWGVILVAGRLIAFV